MGKKVPNTKPKKDNVINFFDILMKKAGCDIPVVSKVDHAAVTTFIRTGSLVLNALLSGSLNGGLAGNKTTALAGEEATGKTFIALDVIGNFLEENPTGHVFVFDSEDDPSKSAETLSERGIDTNRVHVKPVKTIQEFRFLAINIIDAYLETEPVLRQPMFFVLDSLGNLSTNKEMKDTKTGKVNDKGDDVKDMTRAPLIRGLFRVLTIKLGEANVGMLITNHTYETMDPYGAKKNMSGGGGLKYAASTIVYLSKKKLREEGDKTNIIGMLLTAQLEKSRFTRQGKTVDMLLSHETGLNKYYGLFDLGKETGLLEAGTGVEKGNGFKVNTYRFPDGQIGSRKEIEENPTQFFDTQVNYDAFEALCNTQFRFGKGETPPADEADLDEVPDSEFEEPTDEAPYMPETDDASEVIEITKKKKKS